jgi:hypothetical protein
MNDELSGDGTIILDGEVIATVYHWLTVMPDQDLSSPKVPLPGPKT